MKTVQIIALFASVMIWSVSYSQQPTKVLRFKNGLSLQSERLFSNINSDQLRSSRFNNRYYLFLQFDSLPGKAVREKMQADGITLYDYLPPNGFQAELKDSASFAKLEKYRASGKYVLSGPVKISAKLQDKLRGNKFSYDADRPLAVSYYGSMKEEDVISQLKKSGARIIDLRFKIPHVLFIEADTKTIRKITNLPFITYIAEQPVKDIPLSYNNRATHSLDALSAPSGRNLQGRGVTIGVGDDANPATHIDFTGRLLVRHSAPNNAHGTFTTGIAGGAGLINPYHKGMAPQSTLISKLFSDVVAEAPVYITDNNMVLTNNSYYSGEAGCVGNGEYNFLSYYADYQLNLFPKLLHVFASGNDGGFTCSPYSTQFGTIKSGFQCAKNVLTVGNMNTGNYTLSGSSSSGPVDDGRLKPEIVAGGVNVSSTAPNNAYGTASGTSASCPTVTGSLALLYERFRQLHGGMDPDGALIKAIACNTADDLGNAGPDFKFGFGMLNARNAVQAIENGDYISGTIGHLGTVNHNLNIPAGTRQVKIMLYWADVEASSSAGSNLVNNLDLELITPSSATHLPLILDPDAGDVNNLATEGIDLLNNIEQVVVDSPASGNHIIRIKGFDIPYGPQKYYIVYQIIAPSVTVEYPFGNETLLPSSTETIRWTAYGGEGNSFTLEYSIDNGSNWILINNNVSSSSRSYSWLLPSSVSNQAKVRVTRNVSGYSDESDYNFTIIGQPVLTVTNSCQGYASLSWPAISSASGYEIMIRKGDSMQVVATTTANSYLLGGLHKDSSYWIAVRALAGSSPGRRSIAKNIIPSGGACSLTDFDDDLSIDSLLAPVSGRAFTNSQLSSLADIEIRLKNLGNITSSGSFTISYQINGAAPITEMISPTLADHSSLNITFTAQADLSATGVYYIKTWVDYPGDPNKLNDTLYSVVKHLENGAIVLSPAFTEGFETASAAEYINNTMGLTGLDRADFKRSNTNGRVRTFINTGFARTGNRCITLDQIFNSVTSTADSLITTFNLSSYTISDQIWLDFNYKNHGINFSLPGNKVWIRGNENAAWLEVFTLPVSATDIGGYRPSSHINLSSILANAVPAQNFSSSFQIKFGEQGYKSANKVNPTGLNIDNGVSYDDISFTLATNDVSVTAITQPSVSGICNLSATETISVAVTNYSSSALTNVPVKYRVDGITVSELISNLAANSNTTYTFSTPANLALNKAYLIEAWTEASGDTYQINDTSTVAFHTTPFISSFPYLEGFETNNGGWYSSGINSSWQWGAPAKTIITQAASGNNAWSTSLNGNYNDNELSYLYSPCFNLGALSDPYLSFRHIFKTEDACDCDRHWVEYSTNDINWIKLGAVGQGLNWYDFVTQQAWRTSNTSWHTSSIAIPVNAPKLRLRIVMQSDGADNYEGVAIDDVRLFDSVAIPLPLTLLSFEATKIPAGAKLNWTTSQEVNTDKFIIEKSVDNTTFNNIGLIKAAGNSDLQQQYEFIDNNLESGISYYRIRMLDLDGSFTYSAVKPVNNTAFGSVSIFPNPVHKGVIHISSPVSCRTIEIHDMAGRIMKRLQVQGNRHSVNVSDLSDGIYMVSIMTADGKFTGRIIIDQ